MTSTHPPLPTQACAQTHMHSPTHHEQVSKELRPDAPEGKKVRVLKVGRGAEGGDPPENEAINL
jgi:hypothetical protein